MKFYLQADDGFDWSNVIDKVSDYFAASSELLKIISSSIAHVDDAYWNGYISIVDSFLPAHREGFNALSTLVELIKDIDNSHAQTDRTAMEAGISHSRVARKKDKLTKSLQACLLASKRRKDIHK